MQFVVEYKSEGADALALPSLNVIEAETLPLAQREVEKTLMSGVCDSAVIYVPQRVLKANRTIRVTECNGRLVPNEDGPYPAVEKT